MRVRSCDHHIRLGEKSLITQGVRDNEWTERFRAQIKNALRAGEEPTTTEGGYDAESFGIDNKNTIRDAFKVADWANASNVDRTLAVLGTYNLEAKVVPRTAHEGEIRFTATNSMTLGSGVTWMKRFRPTMNGLAGETGAFSKVDMTLTWTEQVSW